MKKFISIGTSLIVLSSSVYAQNARDLAPYWSLDGNSNVKSNSKLGTTNNVPLRFFANNMERMRIQPNGRVGIGTNNPVNILTVQVNGTTTASGWLGSGSLPAFLAFAENESTGFNLSTAANSHGYRPVLNTRRSGGTLASPTAVNNNDFLASYVASGHDGSAFQNPASIDFYVDGGVTTGKVPARISLVTGSNAANRLERLKVGSTGNFNFNNDQLYLQQSNGYVGIGTLNLDFKMNIFSSKVESNNNTNLLKLNGRNPVLGFYDENNIAYGYLKSWTNAPYAPFTNGMLIGSTPGYPIFLSTNYGATMTIADNNKVGIGTTTPAFKLDIRSADVEVSSNNTHILAVRGRNPLMAFVDENGVGYGYLKSWTDAPYAPFTNGMVIGSNPGYPIFLSTNYGVTMTIANNNNVGIGTTNPAHKLSVNGTIQSKELRIESGWADYVFEKDYKLRSLPEVERFVNTHKHLPDVTSGREIEQSGLQVGKVSSEMIRKIEELTLYIIEQDKFINLLRQQNARLEARMDLLSKTVQNK